MTPSRLTSITRSHERSVLQAQRAAGGDPRVGDHDVQAPEGLGGAVDRAHHLLVVGHVALGDVRALAAALGDRRHRLGLEPHERQAGAV